MVHKEPRKLCFCHFFLALSEVNANLGAEGGFWWRGGW